MGEELAKKKTKYNELITKYQERPIEFPRHSRGETILALQKAKDDFKEFPELSLEFVIKFLTINPLAIEFLLKEQKFLDELVSHRVLDDDTLRFHLGYLLVMACGNIQVLQFFSMTKAVEDIYSDKFVDCPGNLLKSVEVDGKGEGKRVLPVSATDENLSWYFKNLDKNLDKKLEEITEKMEQINLSQPTLIQMAQNQAQPIRPNVPQDATIQSPNLIQSDISFDIDPKNIKIEEGSSISFSVSNRKNPNDNIKVEVYERNSSTSSMVRGGANLRSGGSGPKKFSHSFPSGLSRIVATGSTTSSETFIYTYTTKQSNEYTFSLLYSGVYRASSDTFFVSDKKSNKIIEVKNTGLQDYPFESPSFMCINKEGYLVVCGAKGLSALKPENGDLKTVYKNLLQEPFSGIHCGSNGKIYCASLKKEIKILKPDLSDDQTIKLEEVPTGITTTLGDVIVTAFSSQIVFYSNGNKSKTVKFNEIEVKSVLGLSTDAMGNIVVADSGNRKVTVLSPEGGLLFHIKMDKPPKYVYPSEKGLIVIKDIGNGQNALSIY